MGKIILASGSPRRKQLLEWAEVDFEIMARDTAETYPEGMPVTDVPVHIARNKALAVRSLVSPEKIVLPLISISVIEIFTV